MPFVDIKVIAGAFTPEEKRRLVESVSEAVIAIEGEALRPAKNARGRTEGTISGAAGAAGPHVCVAAEIK